MSSTATVSTVVANPIRTGVQGGLAWGITELVDSFHIITMDPRQYVAFLLVLTLVLGALQNAFENYKGKGFLRTPVAHTPVVGVSPVVAPGTPIVGGNGHA